MSILEGDLAEAVTAALTDAGVPYAVTVTRTTPGTPNPSTPWIPGVPVVTPHACRGWTEAYDDATVDGTVIDAKDVKVLVLASTVDIEPRDTDTITVAGATF